MWRVALPGPKGKSKRAGEDAEAETEAATAAAKARPKRSVRKVNEGKQHSSLRTFPAHLYRERLPLGVRRTWKKGALITR